LNLVPPRRDYFAIAILTFYEIVIFDFENYPYHNFLKDCKLQFRVKAKKKNTLTQNSGFVSLST